jgi:hypothetical protein
MIFVDNECAAERGPNRPPPIKTAAPIGRIGGGGKEDTKAGGPSEKQEYYTNRLTATPVQPPRIIATHFGIDAGEAAQ